jgi:hypothetical protein
MLSRHFWLCSKPLKCALGYASKVTAYLDAYLNDWHSFGAEAQACGMSCLIPNVINNKSENGASFAIWGFRVSALCKALEMNGTATVVGTKKPSEGRENSRSASHPRISDITLVSHTKRPTSRGAHKNRSTRSPKYSCSTSNSFQSGVFGGGCQYRDL